LKPLNIIDFKGKSILLLCHENADLDAFCSAAILSRFLKQKKIKSSVAVPSHINEQTLSFAISEKISFNVNPALEQFDVICLFDFNDYEQLGKLRKEFTKKVKKNCVKVFAFDHHEIEKRSIDTSKKFVNAGAFSTTEILFDLIGKKFDSKMSFYASLGMIEDTGRFLVGSKKFFESFSKCLSKSSANYTKVFELAKHKAPDGERIAFLKAAKRSNIIKMKKAIVVTSTISFYHGAVSTKLLDFGADISLVVGTEKKGGSSGVTHLAARAETGFKEEKDFNLMRHLFVPLQKAIGGDAGGHSGAAHWKGNVNEKKVLSEAIKILKARFD
jgi:nanoRNase/pAp phosphatase (c-di-AMP/oligoRNAs hydrolase)